jgi:hypothetical protein
MLSRAVARNFSGKPDAMPTLLAVFHRACFGSESGGVGSVAFSSLLNSGAGAGAQPNELHSYAPPPSTATLISENLKSPSCRHLMVLSQNETALQLLFGCGLIDESSVSVLVGSRFKEDNQELYLIQQINSVKQAMAQGRVALLMNNESIYESLYDVLNQRYVTSKDPETNAVTKLLRLAMGPRSQLCPVKDGFKLIVIVQQSRAYEFLDLPLLNRFG